MNMLPLLTSWSRIEKLRAMEALWTDLSVDQDQMEVPAWHTEVLGETEQAFEEGKATFSDWEEAKARIRQNAASI